MRPRQKVTARGNNNALGTGKCDVSVLKCIIKDVTCFL
jgi:hypothetical protein